jgi:hypothetical protein
MLKDQVLLLGIIFNLITKDLIYDKYNIILFLISHKELLSLTLNLQIAF